MIKKCPSCKKNKEMKSNQKFCSPKCKKNHENSQRSAPKDKSANGSKYEQKVPSVCKLIRPDHLNEIASDYWDKIAPTVMERGHLNVLSEDAFAELCDLYSRLRDINKAINETNRSLLQVEDKWDNKNGVESQAFKESALSDIKRKYSKLFLDYQKQFYLIPLPNRGNFGLDSEEEKDPETDFLNMGRK